MRIDVESLHDVMKGLRHFDRLVPLCDGKEAYVVGGAVRDALIGVPVTDVDLIFPEDPTSIAKDFARQIGGSWFWLDESRLQSRVVVNRDIHCPDYDFAPFRASTLGQDLLDRDFTINAIALPVLESRTGEPLVDPLCGLDDLQQNVLRMVSTRSLAADPLRILKGIRHATALSLDLDAETLHWMQKEVMGLYHISPERIRQEVWKIFDNNNAPYAFKLFSQTMVGNYLFGNRFSESINVLEKSFEDFRRCLQNLIDVQPVVKQWLAEEVEQGLSRGTLLLWSSLLVRLDRDLPSRLAEEWLLSRRSKAGVVAIADVDENVLAEFLKLPLRARPFSWWAFLKRIEPKLLLLAITLGASEEPSLGDLVGKWVPVVNGLDGQQPEALVDGGWLRTELGIQDGPEMSRAHNLLCNAEVTGEVCNEQDARNFLQHHYPDKD